MSDYFSQEEIDKCIIDPLSEKIIPSGSLVILKEYYEYPWIKFDYVIVNKDMPTNELFKRYDKLDIITEQSSCSGGCFWKDWFVEGFRKRTGKPTYQTSGEDVIFFESIWANLDKPNLNNDIFTKDSMINIDKINLKKDLKFEHVCNNLNFSRGINK